MTQTAAGPATLNYEPLAPGSDRLPGGQRVWWMTDEVGGLQCCVATLLGVDVAEVPAGHPGTFAIERGFDMRISPIGRHLFNRFWIGAYVDPRPEGWDRWVLVRARTVVFDPALKMPIPRGYAAIEQIRHAHFAITFDRIEAR